MLNLNSSSLKIFLNPQATDLRKSISGLSALVEHQWKLNPFSGHLFLFCNRRCNLMKALYWDQNGFCLWMKRLEEDRFLWPKQPSDTPLTINGKQLEWLLAGLDLTQAFPKRSYQFTA